MEHLTRTCPKCGPQNFVGRKTMWGLSESERAAYRVREATCTRCGQQGCKVELDRTSPEAKALDEVLADVTAIGWSTGSPRGIGTSPWCSSPTPSTRI